MEAEFQQLVMKGKNKRTFEEFVSRLLPLILLLLPVLAVNLGFNFLSRIELHWKKNSQNELARQELEALTASSGFEYQLARRSGRFLKQLEASMVMKTNSSQNEFIRERCEKIFRKPFPDSLVFAFAAESKSSSYKMIHTNSTGIVGKRVYSLVFQHLVEVNQSKEISLATGRQRERLLQKLMGVGTKSEVVAVSQKGKATYVLYENLPHWFVWDFIETEDKQILGYFVITKVSQTAKDAAKLIALRDCRTRTTGLAGFVPLISGYGGAVLHEKLGQSKIFRNWRRYSLPGFDKNFLYWVENGFPENVKLGKYVLYSYLGKKQTHLTVFLLPEEKLKGLPQWIWWFNLTLIAFFFLLALRGVMFNEWIRMKLSLRFLLLYTLVASFPLSLFAVAASGYLYQFSFSSRDEAVSNLKTCLNQFDARKSLIQDSYRAAALQAFKDRRLVELIQKHGLKHKAVQERIVSFFRNRSEPLPLLGFYLVDLSGKGLHFYEDTTPERLDPAFNVFRVPIINVLRKRFAEKHPDIPLPEFDVTEEQKFGELAYTSVSGNDLGYETEKRRGFPLTRRIGSHMATQIHDFLTVDGKESVLLYILWDDKSVDKRTLTATRDYLSLNFSQFSFVAFRNYPSGLEPIIYPGRHIDSDFLREAQKAAEAAATRGGSITRFSEKYAFLAKPSLKYSDAIIVGGLDQYHLKNEMLMRLLLMLFLIILSFFIVASCAGMTTVFLVRPISEMKAGLEQVGSGNLNIRLASDRSDELGELAGNFTAMVQGIKERRQLAALLSDQAIEAISGGRLVAGEVLPAKKFDGVALVSDIRNFTTLCESRPSEEITEMLNFHFAEMTKIITSNGGRIYKFIGDAIEAIFPEDAEGNAAQKAIKAAVEMNCALAELNRGRTERGEFNYSFGIGLAMGTFYSGQIGSNETRIDYAVIGEPLNRAAELEAQSKSCSDIPIVVDENLKQILGNEFNLTKVSGSENGFEIFAESMQVNSIVTAYQHENQGLAAAEDAEMVEFDSQKTVKTGILTQKFRGFVFALFFLFLMLVGAGVLLGIQYRNEASRSSLVRHTRESVFSLVEQLKSEDAAKIAFELNMKKLIKTCETRIGWKAEPAKEKKVIENLFREKFSRMEKAGFAISRSAIYYFNSDHSGSKDPDKVATTLIAKNMDKWQEQMLKNFACYRARKSQNLPYDKFSKKLSGQSERLFGQNQSVHMLGNELFGSVMPASFQGKEELFYWNYIVVYNPDIYKTSLETEIQKLKKCSVSDFRIVGMAMVAVPVDEVRNSPKFLTTSYDDEEIKFALVSEENEVSATLGFPVLPDEMSISYDSKLPDLADFIFFEEVLRLGQKRFRLLLGSKVSKNEVNVKTAACVIFSLIFLFSIFFYLSLFGNTMLSRSLSAQLWLSMGVISLMPVVTVLFVMDLFLVEHEQALIVQEKVELHRFLDSYELRQTYFSPVAHSFLEKWSTSPNMLASLNKFEKEPGNKEYQKELSDYLQREFDTFERPFGYASNFTPRELFVIGKRGWNLAFSNGGGKATAAMSQVAKEFGRNLLFRLQPEKSSTGLSAHMVKSEIYYESGLSTIRSSFGDDEAMKLANNLNELTEFEVLTGAAAIFLRVLPSLEEPNFLLFWLTKFSSGALLSRIADNCRDRYAVFSVENHRYGSLSLPSSSLGDLDLERFGTLLSVSNLPVSEEIAYGDQKLLVEGRPGIFQFTNFLLAIASKTAITQEIYNLRLWFYNLLLISLLVILLVAFRTSADIILPIHRLAEGMKEVERQNFHYRISIDRDDELGELCQSYDQMAQGLAEKEVMGKMLSQTAVKSAVDKGHTAGARKGTKRDYAFIFVGIPGFSSWLGFGSVDDLFADLQKQTSEVCRIVVAEGGDIDKFVGDKLLGLFSADNPEDAAELAMKAVEKILRAEDAGKLPFPVAVGVNFGEVICGHLGVGEKRDFTVIGDAVNVSARIEKEAEKLRFNRALFSEAFIENVKIKRNFRLFEEVQLKGKTVALKIFSLQ